MICGPLDLEYDDFYEKEQTFKVSTINKRMAQEGIIETEFGLLKHVMVQRELEKGFQDLDRCTNMHNYKHSAVELVNRDGSKQYINANKIKTAFNEEKPLLIATQGPMYNTVNHFWRMVYQEKVGKIIAFVSSVGES